MFPIVIKHSSFETFLVREYIEEYYSKVDLENEWLVNFDVRIINSIKTKLTKKNSTMIDFGFGGVMASMIVAAPYVNEIYIADYPELNIKQSILWKSKSDAANNWNHFTRSILESEYEMNKIIRKVSQDDIESREEELRQKIIKFLHCDAYRYNTLGRNYSNMTFDLVYIGFVHESIIPRINNKNGRILTHNQRLKIWKKVLSNTLRLVAKDGVVIIKALGEANEDYPVGDERYPTLSINEDNIKELLLENGFKEDNYIVESIHSDPDQPRGYPRMISIKAER